MKEQTLKILSELQEKYPVLCGLKENILKAFTIIENTYKNGGKVLLCGNGGSAADCEHIVGELLKSFNKRRVIEKDVFDKLEEFGEDGKLLQNTLEGGLPAISLTSHLALSTAFANDKQPCAVFAQQLYALAKKDDVLIALSTSGNSKNCVLAAMVAKAKSLKVISFTGEKQSKLSNLSDVTINVPETETYKVQELHMPIYHALCLMLEEEFFV